MMEHRRPAAAGLWITGLVLVSTVPFLNRAVFLDEHLFLLLARSILKNGFWAHQDIPTVFFGIQLQNLSTHTHPPVAAYYLSILYRAFGSFSESAFRLGFMVFPILAALAFYQLARRFTNNPLLVTALFVSSPAFFVMSPTLMADIPALAFLLIGFVLYFKEWGQAPNWGKWGLTLGGSGIHRSQDRRCRGRGQTLFFPIGGLSPFFFTLAVGTSYPALIPILCLLFWRIKQRRPLREWVSLLVAPAILGIWLLVSAVHLQQVPLLEIMRYLASHGSAGNNLLAALAFIGGTTVFPWSSIFLTRLGNKRRIAVFAVACAALLSAFHSWPTVPYMLAYVGMASAGFAFLFAFSRPAAEFIKRDSTAGVLFVSWLVATLLFFIVIAEMMAARYLLLILPPLYLVTFRDVRLRAGIVVLAATLGLSLVLAIADYRSAASYRTWADRTLPALQENGFTLWGAAESGLRFYMEQRGIQTLHTGDLRPAGGEIIVRTDMMRYGLSNELEPLLIPIRTDDLSDAFPVRTFSSFAHSGFHDSRIGLLPYSVSSAIQDRVQVAEVSPLVTTLPQMVPADFSSVPLWSPEGVILKQVKDEMVFHPKIPDSAVVVYGLEGKAAMEVGEDSILLRKLQKTPVLWKNLRIVPKSWEQ